MDRPLSLPSLNNDRSPQITLSPQWYKDFEVADPRVKALAENPEALEILAVSVDIDTLLELYEVHWRLFEQRSFLGSATKARDMAPVGNFKEYLRDYDAKYGTVRSYDYRDRSNSVEDLLAKAVKNQDLPSILKGLEYLEMEMMRQDYEVDVEPFNLPLRLGTASIRIPPSRQITLSTITDWVAKALCISFENVGDALVVLQTDFITIVRKDYIPLKNRSTVLLFLAAKAITLKQYDHYFSVLRFSLKQLRNEATAIMNVVERGLTAFLALEDYESAEKILRYLRLLTPFKGEEDPNLRAVMLMLAKLPQEDERLRSLVDDALGLEW